MFLNVLILVSLIFYCYTVGGTQPKKWSMHLKIKVIISDFEVIYKKKNIRV